MMTFYAAAGSYQIRSEDGKNMPYIMRLGKLQPVSIPEFSLWSMLLWDVLTYEELRKKFYDKMEETEIEPSSFDKSLEMLVKRKLIIKGVGYTGADALYNMLSDTYVIPLRGVQGITRRSARSIIMWHSSTRISPASFQHISLIRDIVFFCTSKVVL